MSPALPVVSGEDAVRAPGRVGYSVARQCGSHMRLLCPGRKPVTVPRHRELKPGLLRRILAGAGLSVEEFIRLLGRSCGHSGSWRVRHLASVTVAGVILVPKLYDPMVKGSRYRGRGLVALKRNRRREVRES